MARNNHLMIMGDITGDIYFDTITLSGKSMQYLRMLLFLKAVVGSASVEGLRVVVYGPLAELTYGHVQKGSRIAVFGHIQQRVHDGNRLFEIVAEEIQYIRNVDWDRGEQIRMELVRRGELHPSYKDTRLQETTTHA
jgi:single-stranded DNA-binding protein